MIKGIETIGEYDKVALADGRTVTISHVLVRGEKFLFWDEEGWDEDASPDFCPPEVPVLACSIARIIRQSQTPIYLSPDGWAWLVGEYAELGYAAPLGGDKRVTVQGQLFRKALEITPDTFELVSRREYAKRSFIARHPVFDAEQAAREILDLWESIDYDREHRERDYQRYVPEVVNWLRKLDSAERRQLIDERVSRSYEAGDLIQDEQGRTLIVSFVSQAGKPWVFASEYDPSCTAIPLIGDVVEKRNVVGCIGHVDIKIRSFFDAQEDEPQKQSQVEPAEPKSVDVKTQENREEPRKHIESRWVWCLVGNVKADTPIGKGRAEGKGTRLFSAGTKLYIYPPQFGDGFERMVVLGKPRDRKGGLVKAIVARSHACNFRIKKVWNPEVVRCMGRDLRSSSPYGPYGGWDSSDESKDRIKALLEWINLGPAEYIRYLCALFCNELTFSFCSEEDPTSSWDIRIMDAGSADKDLDNWHVVVSYADAWRKAVFDVDSGEDGPELGDLLVESKVFFWDEAYKADAESGRGFSWTLKVLCRDAAITCCGQNVLPTQLLGLLATLESWGVPFSWDGGLPRPFCGKNHNEDLAFVEAMRAMESDDDLRGRLALSLIGEPGSYERAGLKLLRLDTYTDSCPYFTADEKGTIILCMQKQGFWADVDLVS